MGKKVIIIAGPNGAGKTTFARAFLPKEAECSRFITEIFKLVVASVKLFRLLFYSNGLAPVAG